MRHTISKSWLGETCVILAGGPSLAMQDLSALSIRRPKVITINDSWRLWPYADVFYFCDQEWYEKSDWDARVLHGSENDCVDDLPPLGICTAVYARMQEGNHPKTGGFRGCVRKSK